MGARIRIGCSGWQYAHWRGDFYPRGLAQDRWLEHYAEHLDSVELNNSFYRLPDGEAFAGWRRRVPDGFTFAVKASRYLTHVKRLRDPGEPLQRLWSCAEKLDDRLGPMLYQLPPRWHLDLDRLRTFVEMLPDGRLQALEVRDRSWYAPEALATLRDADVALCIHDMSGSAAPRELTAEFAYVRFHGAAARYRGGYSGQALAAWADRLVGWAADGIGSWVYFNNDVGGHAPRDAARLREMVIRRGGDAGQPQAPGRPP